MNSKLSMASRWKRFIASREGDEQERSYHNQLYIVSLKRGTTSLVALRAVRTIQPVIVRWEPYRGGRRGPTQCMRCLEFGHGSRNCNVQPRCAACAGSHISTDCRNSEEVKCANCQGPHKADNPECPKRSKYLEVRKLVSNLGRQQSKTSRPPPKVPGPPAPALNSLAEFPSASFTTTSVPDAQVWTTDPTPPKPIPQENLNKTSAPTVAKDSRPHNSANQPSATLGQSDLYDPDTLLLIMTEMMTTLRSRRTRMEQLNAVASVAVNRSG